MVSFTCDWGDCEEETTAWRWSGQRLNESPLGWLPVCAIHAASADAKVLLIDGDDFGREYGRKMFAPIELTPDDEDKVADLLRPNDGDADA
jgi:hypothetical protein